MTGASGSIGEAIAARVCAQGAALALGGRDAGRLTRLEEGLRAMSFAAHRASFDVTDDREVEAATAEAAQALGGLDLLITNAGAIAGGRVDELPPEEFRRILEINLTGTFLCIRHAVPYMREAGGGAIVCVASMAGLKGAAEVTPYCASKFGVIGLVQSLAAELGADGIRVVAVAPGDVESPMRADFYDRYAKTHGLDPLKMTEGALARIPLGRFAEPGEVADAVIYLASEMASYVTGVTLPVLGGPLGCAW